MKKKVLITIIIVLLIIASLGLLFIWFNKDSNKDTNIKLLKSTFDYEYGEVIELAGKDILDTKDSAVLKSFNVQYSNLKLEEGKKYPKTGTYDLQINYSIDGKDKKERIKIVVKDTKKPEFTKFSDKIEIKKGSDIKDLNSYFEAKDLSSCEISINSDKLDVNQVGEYTIKVSAKDTSKNEIIKKATVIVVEAAKEATPESNNNATNEAPTQDTGSKATPYTVSEPSYANYIMIANKKHPLPSTYAPGENPEAGNQVRKLIQVMQNLGYDISNSYSGYRSFDTQAGLYQNYANSYGKQEADTFSARAGYSEHQTGLAFDLLHNNGTLVESSPEVKWIAENAHQFGFIVRYQAGKEHITGYQAEPWHIRYIGASAADIYASGLTLEEYLGVQGGNY